MCVREGIGVLEFAINPGRASGRDARSNVNAVCNDVLAATQVGFTGYEYNAVVGVVLQLVVYIAALESHGPEAGIEAAGKLSANAKPFKRNVQHLSLHRRPAGSIAKHVKANPCTASQRAPGRGTDSAVEVGVPAALVVRGLVRGELESRSSVRQGNLGRCRSDSQVGDTLHVVDGKLASLKATGRQYGFDLVRAGPINRILPEGQALSRIAVSDGSECGVADPAI